MRRELRPALMLLALFTVLCGAVYPALITGAAQMLFPRQANGSLVVRDGRPIASALIGQEFTAPGYLWGRPSATTPLPYNAAASSGSNLGPTNPALADSFKARTARLRAANQDATGPIPVELVTASASGLDPDLSPAAAAWQAPRIARARGVPVMRVRELIAARIRGSLLGFLGEPTVNVLDVNLALDSAFGAPPPPPAPPPAAPRSPGDRARVSFEER